MLCNYTTKELKCAGIYQIRNLLDGKIYVGSSFDMQARKREHELDLRQNNHRNGHLQNAYNKYGNENFIFEVLEFLNPEDNQWEREQYWLDKLDVCNKKIGYNIQSEVLIVPKQTKAVVCLETREVFDSLKEAGKKYNINSGSISCCCNKRKLKQTGGYHWRFYDEFIAMTEEEIQEVIFDVTSYPFICLDDGKIYRSWRELPYKKGSITRCCNLLAKGKYAKCYGKQYMFLKDYNKLTQDEIESIKQLKPAIHNSGKVVCLETLNEYENSRRAMLNTGVSCESILNCCYRKGITAGGLHWLFKSDYNKLSKAEIQTIIDTNPIDSFVKAVVCLETGVHYKSIKKASDATEVDSTQIVNCCKNKSISAKGMHFMYADIFAQSSDQDILKVINRPKYQTKKVKCIETRQVFNSVTEAAEYVGGETTNISKCCKNSKYICKGYHWEYVI